MLLKPNNLHFDHLKKKATVHLGQTLSKTSSFTLNVKASVKRTSYLCFLSGNKKVAHIVYAFNNELASIAAVFNNLWVLWERCLFRRILNTSVLMLISMNGALFGVIVLNTCTVTWSPFWHTAAHLLHPLCPPTVDLWRAVWPALRRTRWVKGKCLFTLWKQGRVYSPCLWEHIYSCSHAPLSQWIPFSFLWKQFLTLNSGTVT